MDLAVNSFSHVGRVRGSNEDCVAVRADLRLFVVADGMGGHRAGEVASELCVRTMERALEPLLPVPERSRFDQETLGHVLASSVQRANTAVYDASRKDRRHAGMGTTVVATLFAPGVAAVAHVGDSRAYLLRGRELHQLTVDHNVLEDLVATGVPREEAEEHVGAHYLRRGVGVHSAVHPTVCTVTTQPGDTFLLCSDGLHGELPAQAIAELLRGANAADALLEACLLAGAHDNVSAVVVRVLGESPGVTFARANGGRP